MYLKLGFPNPQISNLRIIHAEMGGRAVNCHFFSAEAKNLNFWKISARIVRGEGTGAARARTRRRQAIKNRTITTKGGEEKG